MDNDTTYSKVKIECPACGHISNFGMFDTIEIQNHDEETNRGKPSLWHHASNGSLFLFTCKECGFQEPMTYAVSCIDVISKCLITVVESKEEEREARDTFDELAVSAPEFKCRMVSATNELVEKLCIFADKLDDRRVELVKRTLEMQLTEDMMAQDDKLYYEDVDIHCLYEYYDAEDKALIFSVEGSTLVDEVACPKDYYLKIDDLVPSNMKGKYRIDSKWAKRVIEEL